MNKNKIAVIGGGSWATALVKILLNNADMIYWWMRNNKSIEYIKEYKHNPKYLPYVTFDTDKLVLSNDINDIINQADILVWVLPSVYFEETLKKVQNIDFKDKFIVSSIKGIIPNANLLVTDYFIKHYQLHSYNTAIIGGPCHSEEVAMEKLSYLTIACEDKVKANSLMYMLSCHYIKTSSTKDVKGMEYASVLKNIIAIASGISYGLGYGDNFQSVLIVNAVEEIKRFLDKVVPFERNIDSSPYLGDLIVTSYSQFSRNRIFGNLIGKGYSVKYSRIEMKMVAEGYYATKCIKEINKKYCVDMPITDAVYNILYNGNVPSMEIKQLSEKFK